MNGGPVTGTGRCTLPTHDATAAARGPAPLPDPHAAAGRLAGVHARIAAAAGEAGRHPAAIRLLAVSKTFGADRVLALAAHGQRAFGENYVQEAVAKIAACAEAGGQLEWHFIGPIQSNKTRLIAERFAWVHSVDREKLAIRLGEQRPAALPPLNCCVQVNVSGEASKRGCAPAEALAVARAIAAQPRLRLRGVMAIPEPDPRPEIQRMRFASVRETLEHIRAAMAEAQPGQAEALDTLSMGMSADLESAIAEGATIVRIGSALFGNRPAMPADPGR